MEAVSDSAADSLLAERLAALGHPARLEILRHLLQTGRCCNKDVVSRLDLAQSTVSQHLRVLIGAGLVRVASSGQRSVYALDSTALAATLSDLSAMAQGCCMTVLEAEPGHAIIAQKEKNDPPGL